jgi:hypothetical protein
LANQRFDFISLHKNSPERKWEGLPQPWDFTLFILEKRKDFVGRQWLFREIDQWHVTALLYENPEGQLFAEWHRGSAQGQATREQFGSIGDDMSHCGAHVVARCVHVRVFVFLKDDRMLVPSDAQACYKRMKLRYVYPNNLKLLQSWRH